MKIRTYQNSDISRQLGSYYDMRYRCYFTRFKFILGISKYGEDDSIPEREEELITQPFKEYDQAAREQIWNTIQKWENNHKQEDNRERDYSDAYFYVSQVLSKMASHIRKENPFDNVTNEFLLHTYHDLDEQEFQVCRIIIIVMWDISSGCNWAYYDAVVEYLLDTQKDNRRDLFTTIKDVEDTVLRLVHKGILSQFIDVRGISCKDGNTRGILEPFICLSFTKESYAGEAIKATGEIFSQEVQAFVGPHTDYGEIG